MPPKKRTRTTQKRSAKNTDTTLNDPTASTSAVADAPAVARRDRHLRGRRGGLESMPDMPLDVLAEIFAFFHPRDLLNLARTSKDFRAFLMSRKSAPFWKEARKNVEGLPALPPRMSEPAYANLLFFNHCHACLKTCHASICSMFFVRYCTSCTPKLFYSIPYSVLNPIQEYFNYTVDESALANTVMLSNDKKNRRRVQYYHKTDLDLLQAQWKTVQGADAAAISAFLEDRKAYVVQCRDAASLLDRWLTAVKENVQADNESRRDERYDAVLVKLREEGWGDELDRMDHAQAAALYNLNSVSRPTKLTDKGWKTIRATVFDFMQATKAERLSREYTTRMTRLIDYLIEIIHEYHHSQFILDKTRPVCAGLSDCALTPNVREALENLPQDAAKGVVTAKLMKILPAVIAKWMEDRRAEYTALVRKALAGSPAARAPEPLDLAMVFFKCGRCAFNAKGLQYPEIVRHSCCRTLPSVTDRYGAIILDAVRPRRYSGPIHGLHELAHYVDMDDRLVYAREVIEACGYDADVVTQREMDGCGTRLRCRLCATLTKQTIFDWRGAIQHALDTHTPPHCPSNDLEEPLTGYWERMPEEHASKARALVSSLVVETSDTTKRYTGMRSDRDPYGRDFVCGWCSTRQPERGLLEHFREAHDMKDPELDADYCLIPHSPFTVTMYAPVYSKSTDVCKQVESGKAFFATF